MTQLTTLAKLKLILGITDNSQDTLLENYINEVSSFIATACGGRNFEATDYEETYDAPDGDNLFLKNYPINSITEIATRGGTIGTPIWTALTTDDFLLYAKEGYVKIISAFGGLTFSAGAGFQYYKVEYNAGYLIDWANEDDPLLHNLPEDLTSLCGQLCASLYNSGGETSGVKSESTEGQSITYADVSNLDLSTGQKNIISRYSKNLV
jgi:Phage gp6-like head-tail connector protein